MTKHTLGRLVGIVAAAVLAAATPVLAAPFAYVTSSFTHDVSVIDTATNTVVASVPVGVSPFGVAAHPAGSHVYVANFGSDTVSVISTATNSVMATVPVQDGPFGVTVHPSGTRAYVANQFSDTISGSTPVYRTASSSGFGLALDDCKACKPVNWGWSGGAAGLVQPAAVTFAWSGLHTLRVQLAEDGVEIDQIVLSPVTYGSEAPGQVKNDSTVVSKP